MRWVLLSLASISCIAVWAFVIMTMLSGGNVIDSIEGQAPQSQIASDHVVEGMSTIGPIEIVHEEEEISISEIIKQRGIQRGDFAKIAPNGEISIDELLSFFEKDQH